MRKILLAICIVSGFHLLSVAQNVGIGTSSPGQKLHVAGNLKLDGKSVEGTTSYRVYRNLATYNSSSSAAAGAFVIQTTHPWNNACMFRMKIEGYFYDATAPFEITIGGYMYISNNFVNTGYVNVGSKKLSVRLGRNSTTNTMVVILGDEATSYSYPKLTVSSFTQGHSTINEAYIDGWTISQQTSLANYSYLHTVPDQTTLNVAGGWTDLGTSVVLTTTTDNVGVGTSTPSDKWHVAYNSGTALTGTTAYGGILLEQTGPNDDFVGITVAPTGNGTPMATQAGILFQSSGGYGTKIHFNTTNSYAAGMQQRMTLDHNGNLGIGTNNPQEMLHINGSVRGNQAGALRISSGTGVIDVGSQNAQWAHIQTDRPRFYFSKAITVDEGLIGSYDEDLQLQTSGTTRMFLRNSDGFVGIGTTSPSTSLHLVGGTGPMTVQSTGAESDITFLNSSGGNWQVGTNNAGNGTGGNHFYFYDNAYRLTIQAGTGNVGIGTLTPATKLDVVGQVKISGGNPGNGKVLTSDANGLASWKKPGEAEYESAVVTAGNWYRIAVNSPGSRENAEFTLRDYISSGGHSTVNFRIGQSYSDATNMSFTMLSHSFYVQPTFTKVRLLHATTYDAQYLEVYVARSGDVDFSIYDNLQSAGWAQVDWTLTASIPGGYTSREFEINNLFTVGDYDDRFTIARGGNVGINNTNPTYALHVNGKIKSNGINETSDIRMKRNIVPISGALSMVVALQGVTYDWRLDEFPGMEFEKGKQIGVIAQEIEKIVPEVVHTDAEGYKSVEYSHLVPLLIEAIKEQQQQIDEQNSKIEKLMEQNNILSQKPE